MPFYVSGQDFRVIPGHAHNDYENKRPLYDALDNGFISVEADVHLVGDNLYVSHDSPEELNPDLTLESMYLAPLKALVIKNKGNVYPGYTGTFYLMIDLKTAGKPAYTKLKTILSNYTSMLTLVENGVEKKGPVNIFISGNRPIEEILGDESKLATLDGRPEDLDKNYSSEVMPVISENYSRYLSWDGTGEINAKEMEKFKTLVKNTHARNKLVRLWAIPDTEVLWEFLLDQEVDLINTDRISDFRKFMESYAPQTK